MKGTLKASHYNVLVPVPEEGEFLLYNTLSGGVELLGQTEGELVARITDAGAIESSGAEDQKSLLDYLSGKGYLVPYERDEIKELHDSYARNQSTLFQREEGSIALTIGTTIVCNMGCPYCFEFVKPNKSLKADELTDSIINYLESMIRISPVKVWRNLGVCWYGGEPLINKRAIEKLTPRLRAFCAEHNMHFSAKIITNGLLLNEATWGILQQAGVDHAQITIDGAKEVHDKYRPLKQRNGKNYERILENIAAKPDDIGVTIRVNVDKQVASTFGTFFQDLKEYGIWPQKHKSVTVDTAWLRSYAEAGDDLSGRLSNEDYFEVEQDFRRMKLKLYNEWAVENGRRPGKLQWVMPKLQEDCATWVSPYNIVLDPEGNIHKCWETIHDDKGKVAHVSEEFDIAPFKEYMAFNRSSYNPICTTCQYLPVCDKVSCSYEALKNGKPPCTYWKTKTAPSLKEQYLLLKHNPDAIASPENLGLMTGSGHANK